MVLNKKEKATMNVIYKTAVDEKGQCLLSPLDILQKIPYRLEYSEDDLERVLTELSQENYFHFEKSKYHGELFYIITLKEKGYSYFRDKKTARRKLIVRILTAIALAILSYVIKLILPYII